MEATLIGTFQGRKLNEKLILNKNHPLSRYGIGVLQDKDGDVFDGFMFSVLRDNYGCKIVTDAPEEVCRALGLPYPQKGIRKQKKTKTRI